MKIQITKDEWYPVYSIEKRPFSDDLIIEVSKQKLKEWEQVFEAFDKMQIEMRDLMEEL